MGNAVTTPPSVQTSTTPVVSPSAATQTIERSDRSVTENVIYYNNSNGEELVVYSNGFLITSNNSQDRLLQPQTVPSSKTRIENAILLSENSLLTYEADDTLRLYRLVSLWITISLFNVK
jgi:hypothetical protein